MNIELTAHNLVGLDLKEILLPEQELKLRFSSSLYNLDVLLVTAKNGEKKVKKKLVFPFEIDISELLFAGTIEAEISLISNNEAVKTWRLQPLHIKENEHQFKAIPEIVRLNGAILEINEKLKRNNII